MTLKGVERRGKGRPLSWATPTRMLMHLGSSYNSRGTETWHIHAHTVLINFGMAVINIRETI